MKRFLLSDEKTSHLPPNAKHNLISFGLIKKEQLNKEDQDLHFKPFCDEMRQKIAKNELKNCK